MQASNFSLTGCDGVKISLDLERLRQRFESGEAFSFFAYVEDTKIPVFLKKSDRYHEVLFVAYNGAVDRNRSQDGVVFQRSTWADEINASFIGIADPTLLIHQRLSLGWGQVDGKKFAPILYLKLIEFLREVLGLPAADRTLHFGSSAGGYQAFCTSVLDKRSRNLTNNPQFDWFAYDLKSRVQAVQTTVLKDSNGTRTLLNEPWRVRAWELVVSNRYFPRSETYVNVASYNDFEIQYMGMIRSLRAIDFVDTTWRNEFIFYRDPVAKHSPLAKVPALASINRSLGFLR